MEGTMGELKTDQTLLEALKKAAADHPGHDELEKQRVSFIMGTLGSESQVTRERVEQELARQEGRAA
jgi:hypothetical protein